MNNGESNFLSPSKADSELYHIGKAELTAFSCDMLTDLYTATATLWKVEVTDSNV